MNNKDTWICPKCGTVNDIGRTVCHACGTNPVAYYLSDEFKPKPPYRWDVVKDKK